MLERQGKTVADVVPVYRRVPVVSEPEENHMEGEPFIRRWELDSNCFVDIRVP